MKGSSGWDHVVGMDDERTHSFRIIYDDSYDDLWRYCLRRCATATHAEDVLGETFAVAWRRFDELPDPPATRPYLFGIARNLIRDHHRRAGRDDRLTARLQQATRTRAAERHDRDAGDEDLAVVVEALHELSHEDQEILRLAAWESLPHAEIAIALACSVNAVGIRLHRARKRLVAQIAERDLAMEWTSSTTSSTSTTPPTERSAS